MGETTERPPGVVEGAWRAHQSEQERYAARGRIRPYEYQMHIDRNEHRLFDTELSLEEQRDELLAFVGLLVEWGLDVVPILHQAGHDYSMIEQTLQDAVGRYGRWQR